MTRKLATSSLGGEAFSFSEMIHHVSPLREFSEPSLDISPGMAGLEDFGSLFTHLGTERTFLVHHFSGAKEDSGNNELGNV